MSASTLCRIEDGDSFMLLRNKNAYGRGEIVFSPVGGAIEATEFGRLALMREFGVTDDGFENGDDLRFMLSEREIGRFAIWLTQCDGRYREIDPERELVEELCEESELLLPQDIRDVRSALVGYYMERAVSYRENVAQPTVRIAEVYDTLLPGGVVRRLHEDYSGQVLFASVAEIREGISVEGMKIASIARALVDFKRDISA